MECVRPPAYVPPSPTNPFHGISQAQRGRDQDAHLEPLPTYSRPSTRQGQGRRRPTTAQGHSHRSRAPCAEHIIPMSVSDSSQAHLRSWAQMRIQSSAKSKHHTPSYHPGDEIVGFLELDLLKEKSISGIHISLRGYIGLAEDTTAKPSFPSPGYLGPLTKPLVTFLDFKSTLWKPSMGDPRSVSPTPINCANPRPNGHARRKSMAKDFKEKLLGSYSFPFLFTLPHEVDNELLPPDFTESQTEDSILIKYELEVTIQTALFKADATILCPFHVVPQSTPPLPSPSRELIYTCRADSSDTQHMPPGPEQDSEGWTRSKAITLTSSSCIVSLANPLNYTRGTPIHIHMSFLSSDVPDPSTLRIGLVRTLRAFDGSSRLQKRAMTPPGTVTRSCVASAVCYRRPSDVDIIHAEIKVPKDLTPNFEFKGIKVQYHVALFPMSAASTSYLNLNLNVQPLYSVPVKIATNSPFSPESRIVPLSFIPPGLAAIASEIPCPPSVSHSRRGSPGLPSSCRYEDRSRGALAGLDPLEQLLGMHTGVGWK